jgi:dual specificity MAP kinase phosphatase
VQEKVRKLENPKKMPAEVELIGKDWLKENLAANKHLIILDCRSSTEYAASHIIKSLNISIPSILLRRLAAGKIDLFSTIKCRDLKNRILDNYSDNIFVLYHNTIDDSIINILYRKLMAELSNNGCRVLVLEGTYR